MSKERPLSPHIGIYKPQLTSVLSIMHRLSGVFLATGTPLLVAWIASIAAGPEGYAHAQQFASHWFIQLLLVGWTVAMMYHLCNGVRHLFWDAGKGFELDSVYRSGWLVLIIACLLSAAVWYAALAGGLS